jgi:hypothetical protein
MGRLLDHRLDYLPVDGLAFEPRGPLDQGDEFLRLPLRLLPFQIGGATSESNRSARPRDSAIARMFEKLAAAWRPERIR